MSNRVYTYTKISELRNAHFWKELVLIPQITMSMEVASTVSRELNLFGNRVLGFSAFQNRLFPSWNSSSQKFSWFTILNRFFREKIAQAESKGEREWLFGCKKNIPVAIQNIIHLEEAGVHPEDVRERDRDLSVFLEMWRLLIKEDASIIAFRKRTETLKNPEIFLQEVVGNKILRFGNQKKIIWHGFQYLTPIQQFVYDCFCNAGFDIYALIQDDIRYPYANEIWKNLYHTGNAFPEQKDWIRQEIPYEKNPLGEIFESGEVVKASGVKLIKYHNTIEFIEDIERIKSENFYIYSADDKAANNVLKSYFPEKYERRNLLAYPIGQFIYTLHDMWDENRQTIVLSQNGLRKCFASGWLSANGKSSASYTEELERILPYFEGCHTVDEWNERLNILYDSIDDAVSNFTENDKVMGNPFAKFGVFSIDADKLNELLGIIAQLMSMAKKLFGNNEPVSIHKHMSKLDAMLYMQDGMPRDLYMEEREKVKRIFEVLASDSIKDFLCYPGDLAVALRSFMGDKFDEEDENQYGLRSLVFHIYQIEAAQTKEKGKVHICFADISKLPGSAGKYTWPLDEELLKHIADTKKHTYLSNWIENNHLIAMSNRYYIYSALKNPNVEISWIEKQGEKLYAPSPYITLLDQLSDVKIESSEVHMLNLQDVAEIEPITKINKEYDIRKFKDYHVYDTELEYAICPMRHVYSNILGNDAAYRSTYQQNHALVRFIQALNRLFDGRYTIEKIAEQVFELFPNIRKAEKRQILDDAMKWYFPKDSEYTEYNGEKYTDYRLHLLFPDDEIYQAAKMKASRLMSQEGQRGIEYLRKGDGKMKNCRYCPHADYCRNSLFGIDYKGEKS